MYHLFDHLSWVNCLTVDSTLTYFSWDYLAVVELVSDLMMPKRKGSSEFMVLSVALEFGSFHSSDHMLYA